MSAVDDAPVMPPTDRLLALLEPDPTLLGRVLLAQLCGAYWIERRGAWWLHVPTGETAMGERGCLFRLGIGDTGNRSEFKDYGAPNPFADSCAAWGLMVRERISMIAPEDDQPTWCAWSSGKGANEHADAMRACAVAVLRAHATGPLSALIVPTLERLENAK